jgi:hypothetical protein
MLISTTADYDLDSLHTRLHAVRNYTIDVHVSHAFEGGVFFSMDPDKKWVKEQITFIDALHEQCAKADFSPARLHLHWGNLNATELYHNWCAVNNPVEQLGSVGCLNMLLPQVVKNTAFIEHNKTPTKLFTYLNSAQRKHREDALNYIYENGLLDMCEWTWFNDWHYNLNEHFHTLIPKSAEGLEWKGKPVADVDAFAMSPELIDMHTNTCFDLIAETFYHHDVHHYSNLAYMNTVYFTEKTWRALILKRPFLLIGNKDSLTQLKALGFKTFPMLFDESYDTLDDDKRLGHVLAQLNSFDVESMFAKINTAEVQDILEHNLQQALNLSQKMVDIESKMS